MVLSVACQNSVLLKLGADFKFFIYIGSKGISPHVENNENNTCFIAFSNFFCKVCNQFTKRGQPSRGALVPIGIIFFQIAPTLRIDAVTKKTSQSVPPIYIKKTAQNTYIRGSLFFLYILVGHYGHFNVARC